MSSFAPVLSGEEAEAIRAYLVDRAHYTLASAAEDTAE